MTALATVSQESPFRGSTRPVRICDVALRVVTARFDALLDTAGPDFTGGTTAAWTAEEAAEFEQLKSALKVLGDHGSPWDPCRCKPINLAQPPVLRLPWRFQP